MATSSLAIAVALAAALPLSVAAQDFQKGPEEVGHSSPLAGRVIGMHGGCALVAADMPRQGWRGLGGNGRFFLCAPDLAMGQQVHTDGIQVGTRWTRWGPRWRVVPVYRPITAQ